MLFPSDKPPIQKYSKPSILIRENKPSTQPVSRQTSPAQVERQELLYLKNLPQRNLQSSSSGAVSWEGFTRNNILAVNQQNDTELFERFLESFNDPHAKTLDLLHTVKKDTKKQSQNLLGIGRQRKISFNLLANPELSDDSDSQDQRQKQTIALFLKAGIAKGAETNVKQTHNIRRNPSVINTNLFGFKKQSTFLIPDEKSVVITQSPERKIYEQKEENELSREKAPDKRAHESPFPAPKSINWLNTLTSGGRRKSDASQLAGGPLKSKLLFHFIDINPSDSMLDEAIEICNSVTPASLTEPTLQDSSPLLKKPGQKPAFHQHMHQSSNGQLSPSYLDKSLKVPSREPSVVLVGNPEQRSGNRSPSKWKMLNRYRMVIKSFKPFQKNPCSNSKSLYHSISSKKYIGDTLTETPQLAPKPRVSIDHTSANASTAYPSSRKLPLYIPPPLRKTPSATTTQAPLSKLHITPLNSPKLSGEAHGHKREYSLSSALPSVLSKGRRSQNPQPLLARPPINPYMHIEHRCTVK